MLHLPALVTGKIILALLGLLVVAQPINLPPQKNYEEAIQMKKYRIDENIITPSGNIMPKGFDLIIEGDTARIEVPSDVWGDNSLLYEEEIPISQQVFRAQYNDGDRCPVHIDDGEGIGIPAAEYYAQFQSVEVKLFLVDENGVSPSFGVDETVTISPRDHQEQQKLIADAIEDFAHHLVAHEDFAWSDVVGYHVTKDGRQYEVRAVVAD